MWTSDRDYTVIRQARTDERAILEAIQWNASLANDEDRQMLLQHPDAIELPENQIEQGGVFVAELNDTPIGFSAILLREDGQTELDGLFVEPEYWRRGIGRKLVLYSEQAARESGSRAIHVIGNQHAQTFYKQCGFITIGVSKTRFGEGLLMYKLLV